MFSLSLTLILFSFTQFSIHTLSCGSLESVFPCFNKKIHSHVDHKTVSAVVLIFFLVVLNQKSGEWAITSVLHGASAVVGFRPTSISH